MEKSVSLQDPLPLVPLLINPASMADGVEDFNDGQLVLNTPDRDRDSPAPVPTQLKVGRPGPGVDGNATGGRDDPVAVSTVINKLFIWHNGVEPFISSK